jgi:hypothetical protein
LGGVEQDVIEAHAKRTFNAIKDDLEEALCACGNEMLADAWSREREVIKGNRRAARKAAKLATAA